MPADVAQQRLHQALVLADRSPDAFVGALLPTMLSEATAPELVEAFGASMLAFHPDGFRAMARASAEDLREVLPHIDVPTLLVYGDKDVRAGLPVAEDLHATIPGSTLVVLPDTGHVCNIEALRRSTVQSGTFSATRAADHTSLRPGGASVVRSQRRWPVGVHGKQQP